MHLESHQTNCTKRQIKALESDQDLVCSIETQLIRHNKLSMTFNKFTQQQQQDILGILSEYLEQLFHQQKNFHDSNQLNKLKTKLAQDLCVQYPSSLTPYLKRLQHLSRWLKDELDKFNYYSVQITHVVLNKFFQTTLSQYTETTINRPHQHQQLEFSQSKYPYAWRACQLNLDKEAENNFKQFCKYNSKGQVIPTVQKESIQCNFFNIFQ